MGEVITRDSFAKRATPNSIQDQKPANLSDRIGLLSFLTGLSVPTGDFASRVGQNAGYAGPGFCATTEYLLFISHHFHWLVSTSLSYNSMNQKALLEALGSPSGLTAETGYYLTLCPMSGFGFITTSADINLYGSIQAGLLFGRTPEIKLSYGGSTASQEPASSNSLAAAAAIGIITSKNFIVTIRYITGKPNYTVTSVGGSTTVTNEFDQSTSLLLVMVGVGI